MSLTGVVALAVGLALFALVGVLGKTRQQEFFLAGRKAGALTVGPSLMATCVRGSATLGREERA